MNAHALWTVSWLLLVSSSAAARGGAPAQDPRLRELIRKADMVMRGKTSAGVFEMEIKTAHYQRAFKVVVWDDSSGNQERTLIKILGPALWRGFGTLKLGTQLKLYNPKNNHVTVVSHSMLGDAWMGSHFSNDDLVKETRLADHYRGSILSSRPMPSPSGDGTPGTRHLVRLLPLPTAPVAWGAIQLEVWEAAGRGLTVLPVLARYYRKATDRSPVRTMTFGRHRALGGRIVPSEMTVRVASKPGEFTRIRYQQLKFDIKIPALKFTEQALQK